MTWQERKHAIQHLAEERLGREVRKARQSEDAQFAASRSAG